MSSNYYEWDENKLLIIDEINKFLSNLQENNPNNNNVFLLCKGTNSFLAIYSAGNGNRNKRLGLYNNKLYDLYFDVDDIEEMANFGPLKISVIRGINLKNPTHNHMHDNISYFLLFLFSIYLIEIFKEALDLAIEYSKTRTTFNVPLHQHQLVVNYLVKGFTEFKCNELLILDLLTSYRKGIKNSIININHFGNIADSLLEGIDNVTPVMGAYAYTEESNLCKLLMTLYKGCILLKELKIEKQEDYCHETV